jgi:Zn-dependent protease with chaperone function
MTSMRRLFGLCSVVLLLAQLACSAIGYQPSSSNGNMSGASPAPHFKAGFNLYSPQQDVEMGRRSAEEIVHQQPLINDARVVGYIRDLGTKLAAKAPGEKFEYQFNVVGSKEINAFALPGGFVFVNLGAIVAAKREGELAGVMAHEISHVALRHGTNQATKAYLAKAGLGVLSTIAAVGGRPDVSYTVQQIGGYGANLAFLKFSRSAESQADLEGADIMADAGYDPRDMASFFKTLEEQGGQGVPQFLSDHPDPGNRVAAINARIPKMRISSNPTRDTQAFQQCHAVVTGGAMPAGASQLARVGQWDPNRNPEGSRPAQPDSNYKPYRAANGRFAMELPQNWDPVEPGEANVIAGPKGGYGALNKQIVVTHGIFAGSSPAQGNLAEATAAFIKLQLQDNPDFHVEGNPQQVSIAGRPALATVVSGPSAVTGVMEVDVTYTVVTPDNRLLYLITIVPEDEAGAYRPAFERAVRSITLGQ